MLDDAKYVRTTISVPPQLRERMDAVDESVNWSAVASRAFEAKLVEIAAKKEQKSMDDIVARLRVSKRRVDDEQYQEGEKVGRAWVEEDAEADELENLERWLLIYRGNEDAIFRDDLNHAYSSAELTVFGIWPDRDGDRSAAEEFWEERLGDDASAAEHVQFVRGFVDGALDMWRKVKDQL
jgi:hypothetical protein